MIKIEIIESLDGKKSKLSDLADSYYAVVNSTKYGVVAPLQRLNNAIVGVAPGIAFDVLTYCIANYEQIVKGLPTKLAAVVAHSDANGWTNHLTAKANSSFRDELLDIFGYNDRFRLVKSKGVWFADKLNVKACPYCNAQFTITTREKGSPKKAKFQFDHFYNKSSYPHLSISMYNLIPSCAACNVTKSKKPMGLASHYHPYESTIMDKMKFVLDNESVLNNILLNSIDAKIIKTRCEPTSPVYKNFVEEHCKLYDIEGVYANHADYAEEILAKALMYPESKKNELMKIAGLFKDKATFQRYLLGNYPDEKDILKRPLAKFTQDIARQLKLIE